MNKQKFFYHLDQLQVLGKCSRILKEFIGKITKNFPKSNFMVSDEIKKKKPLNELIEPVISNGKKLKKSNKIIRKEELRQLKNISSLILRDTMTLKVLHYPQPSQQGYKSLNLGKNAIKEKNNKGVTSCQNYFVVTIPGTILQQNNLSLKHRHLGPLQHTTKRHFAIIKLKHKPLHKGKMIFYVDCDVLNHHNKIVERKLRTDSHGGNLFEDKNFQKSSGNNDQDKNMEFQCKNSTDSLIRVLDIFTKYDVWHTSIPNFKILCCKMHTNSKRFLSKNSEDTCKSLDNLQECRSKQHYNDILKLRIKQKSKILMDQLKTAADIVKPAFISENANKKFTKGDVVSKFNNNKFNVSRNNPEDISRNIKKLLNTSKSDIAFNESFNLHKKYIKNEVSSRPFSINSRIWKFNIENLIIPFKTNKELEIKRTWNTFIKKYKLKSKNHNDLTEYKITSKLRDIGNGKKETEKEYLDKPFTDDYNCNTQKTAVKSVQNYSRDDSGYQEIKSPSLNSSSKSLSPSLNSSSKSSCRFTIENEELSDDEDEVIKKKSNLKPNQGVINKNFRKNIEMIYPISKLNYDDISAFYGNTQQNDSSVKEIVNENNLKTYNTDNYDTKNDFFLNLLKKSMKAEDLNEFLDNIKTNKNSANDILIKFCNRLMFISKDVNHFTNVTNIKKIINLKNETDFSTVVEKIKNEINLRKINLNEVQKKEVMVRFNYDDDKNSKLLVTTTKNIPKRTFLNKINKGKSGNDDDDDDDGDDDNIIRSLRTNESLKSQATKSPDSKNVMEIKRIDKTVDKNIDNIIIKKEKINKSLLHDLLNEGNAFLKFLPIINESLKTYLKSYQNSNLSNKDKIIHKIDRLKYAPFRKLPNTSTELLKMNLEDEKKLNDNKNKEKEVKVLIVKPSDKEIPTVTKDSLLSTINHENEELLPNAYSSTNVENIIMKDDLLVLSVKVKIPFSSVLLVLGKKDANFSGRVVAKKINK